MPDLGRRCDIGCETWPDSDDYEVCPQCGEPTKRYRGVRPLDEDEALSRKRHLDFDAYYEEREERRRAGDT